MARLIWPPSKKDCNYTSLAQMGHYFLAYVLLYSEIKEFNSAQFNSNKMVFQVHHRCHELLPLNALSVHFAR